MEKTNQTLHYFAVWKSDRDDQCALVDDFDDWVGVLSLSIMWEFPKVGILVY